MPNLGVTMQTYILEIGTKFSMQSVCHLGIELVNALEEIHSAGYVYNDLKPDNIVLGSVESLL